MAVGLQLAGKNDFVKVQEDINDNLIKLDEAIDFNLLATLGIEYGGILNNANAKVAGKAYYDTTGKKLYKCIVNTSINYADAGYFEALSNNDLLGKIQDLDKVRVGSCQATNKDGSIVGNTLNFNAPVSSAVAIHFGANPVDTNIVLETPASVLANGIVRFKSGNTASITVFYIVILR